jgi:hypothetical protein
VTVEPVVYTEDGTSTHADLRETREAAGTT